MDGGFFGGIARWETDWKDRRGKVPVFYFDNSSLTAVYTASTARVKALLPHPAMRPIELLPGRCLAAFTAFEYRKTDIDPYNEFSISFLIRFGRRQIPLLTAAWQMLGRRFTTYIWQLPVTTEIARYGGVEFYGYPKFIADIDFSRQDGHTVCRLSEKGQLILTLSGRDLATSPGSGLHYVTYSIKDGVPIRTNVLVNPLQLAQVRGSDAARLELGTEHPICRSLREMELGRSPIFYQYSPNNQAILFAGRNLMDG